MKIVGLTIILLILETISSKSIEANDCASICKFNDDFNPSTGYDCFHKRDNETLCTCPDHQLTTINQPCRICSRTNICGSKGIFCSEKFLPSNRTTQQPNSYFACFCQSEKFVMDDKCPDDDDNDSSQNTTTTAKVPISNSTAATISPSGNVTTVTCVNHGNRLNRFVESMLIILLNLVYFINK